MTTQNNTFICPSCGTKIHDYKHGLNKTLIECLYKLYCAGGLSRLDRMKLNNSQFTNFQKLKYFRLVVQTGNKNEWQITRWGIEFLQGRRKINRFVWTRNANVIKVSDEIVYVWEVKDCVQYRVEWQEQARQPNLFDAMEKI